MQKAMEILGAAVSDIKKDEAQGFEDLGLLLKESSPLRYRRADQQTTSQSEVASDFKGSRYPVELAPRLIQDFVKLASSTTDAAPEFLVAAGVSAVSALAGPSVTVSRGLKLNLYVVLCGRTGISRKTTAQSLGLEIIRAAQANIEGAKREISISTVFSVEGAQSAMADGRTLILAPQEYKEVFDISKRQTQSNTVTVLTGLYDCKPIHVHLRNESFEVKEPYLGILACSTESWLKDLVTKANVAGGFVNRHLIVSAAPASDPLIFPEPISDQEFSDLARRFASISPSVRFQMVSRGTQVTHSQVADKIHLGFADLEAREFWQSYAKENHSRISSMAEEDGNALARESIIALKLAGISALAENNAGLTLRDLNFGVAWAKASSEAAIRLTGSGSCQLREDTDAKLAYQFLGYVERIHERTKGPVTRKEVWSAAGGSKRAVIETGAKFALEREIVQEVGGGYLPSKVGGQGET